MFTLNTHLLVGVLFALPFFVLNALVVSGAPIVAALRSETAPQGYVHMLILGLIALIFVGGLIALYPAIKTRRLMMLNILVGIVYIGFSILLGYGLGVDVYHCDILKIPNCD